MNSPATAMLDLPLALPPTPECRSALPAFIRAIEARDWAAIARTLHPDVELLDPLDSTTRRGEFEVMSRIDLLGDVLRNFRHTAVLGTPERAVLHFTGDVGDHSLDGLTLLEVDELGLVDRVTIMIRPLAGLLALSEAARLLRRRTLAIV